MGINYNIFRLYNSYERTTWDIFNIYYRGFYGGLAVSLAEVFDVVPIFMRRARLLKGIVFFVTAIALGKTLGSLAYFLIPGFYR